MLLVTLAGFFLFVFVSGFLGPHPWRMEVPRLRVQSELQRPAYTTATATRDPRPVCDLHHSSWQRQLFNSLSEVMDWTFNLMVPRWIRFCCATMGTLALAVLKTTSGTFGKMALYWNWSVFLMIRLGLCLRRCGRGEEKTTWLKSNFHHILSKVHIVNINFPYCLWPNYLTQNVFVKFLHYCSVCKEVPTYTPHLWRGFLSIFS